MGGIDRKDYPQDPLLNSSTEFGRWRMENYSHAFGIDSGLEWITLVRQKPYQHEVYVHQFEQRLRQFIHQPETSVILGVIINTFKKHPTWICGKHLGQGLVTAEARTKSSIEHLQDVVGKLRRREEFEERFVNRFGHVDALPIATPSTRLKGSKSVDNRLYLKQHPFHNSGAVTLNLWEGTELRKYRPEKYQQENFMNRVRDLGDTSWNTYRYPLDPDDGSFSPFDTPLMLGSIEFDFDTEQNRVIVTDFKNIQTIRELQKKELWLRGLTNETKHARKSINTHVMQGRDSTTKDNPGIEEFLLYHTAQLLLELGFIDKNATIVLPHPETAPEHPRYLRSAIVNAFSEALFRKEEEFQEPFSSALMRHRDGTAEMRFYTIMSYLLEHESPVMEVEKEVKRWPFPNIYAPVWGGHTLPEAFIRLLQEDIPEQDRPPWEVVTRLGKGDPMTIRRQIEELGYKTKSYTSLVKGFNVFADIPSPLIIDEGGNTVGREIKLQRILSLPFAR